MVMIAQQTAHADVLGVFVVVEQRQSRHRTTTAVRMVLMMLMMVLRVLMMVIRLGQAGILQHRLLRLFDDVHRLFDFALSRLVALRLRLDNGHRRMEAIDAAAIVFGALQTQRCRNALLLVELHQHTAGGGRFGESRVFHLAAEAREVVHHVVELPVRQDVQHDDGATDLFDFARIVVGRQLRIGRQMLGLQFRIAGGDVLRWNRKGCEYVLYGKICPI